MKFKATNSPVTHVKNNYLKYSIKTMLIKKIKKTVLITRKHMKHKFLSR